MNNTLKLPIGSSPATYTGVKNNLSIVSINGQTSLRRLPSSGGLSTELVFSHVNTKENATRPTRRTSIRLNKTFLDPDDKVVHAAAQLVLINPLNLDSSDFDPTVMVKELLGALVKDITNGGSFDENNPDTAINLSEVVVAALNGEI
jgi:hypothetical protein